MVAVNAMFRDTLLYSSLELGFFSVWILLDL